MTPETSGRPSEAPPKVALEPLAVTLEAWTQSGWAPSARAAPELSAIEHALERLSVALSAKNSCEHYDLLLHTLAKRGNRMHHAVAARTFLNANLRARLARFKDDLSQMSPAQAKQSLVTLRMMRKLDAGSTNRLEIGNLLNNYAIQASALQAPAALVPSQATPAVLREAYSRAVNAARTEVGGGRAWSALRAVQVAPNMAGVVVGALGSTIGRGSFAKVKPFAFGDGYGPRGEGGASSRYVARITRDSVDKEKKNLRGLTYRGYGATTSEMTQNEIEALEAVDSELRPVAIFEDDKGRRLEVVPYFDRSLRDLITEAPALRTNGAFLHSVTRTLLAELQRFDRAGYVHLDIKPANILYDYARMFAVFGDYGFARERGFSDFYGGTEHYMSPEMQRGKPSKVDTRSDLFSLAYSIVAFSADTLLVQTPLMQRSKEQLLADKNFRARALAAMSPRDKQQYFIETNPAITDWMLAQAVLTHSSEVASHALKTWYISRFGSLSAPLSIAALEKHDTPMDQLFLHLARAEPLTAEFVAKALQGDKADRGVVGDWLDRFEASRAQVDAAQHQNMVDTIASLRAGDVAGTQDMHFARLQQFVQRIDVERPTFADSDDEEGPVLPSRGRSRGRR